MIPGVELSMDALALLADGDDAQAKLGNFVAEYRDWLLLQRTAAAKLPPRRRQTVQELLDRAKVAAGRIEQGIALLNEPRSLEAFRIANRAMAAAARQRLGVMAGKEPTTIHPNGGRFNWRFC